MRKIQGIKSLLDYLSSVNYPMTEDKVKDLIMKRQIPHNRPIASIIIFDLDHIDWWLNERQTKLET